jgi:putative metallohydrolase (TIGR04338 family)
MGSTRTPRDAQRSRVYLAETPLPSSPLPGLDACATFADRVVGTFWWQARFPEHTIDAVPRLRPGNGARQAFFRVDPDGPTITLPRRYRTKGVVLHELVHWAMAEVDDLPHHGRTFARILLDATAEFCGPDRADALAVRYRESAVHVARPARQGPDGRWHYGWDERLRLGKGRRLTVHHHAAGGGLSTVTSVFAGFETGGAALRFAGNGAGLRVRTADVWRVEAARV